MKFNEDTIREKRHIVDHNYKVGDKFMLTKQNVYKNGTPYMGPFGIIQCLPMAR